MISICDIKNMFGGKTKHNPWDSTNTTMLIIWYLGMQLKQWYCYKAIYYSVHHYSLTSCPSLG